MKVWVDPPSGWRYGFPKVFDRSGGVSLSDWLRQEGYPEEDLALEAWIRMWPVEDKDVE